MSSDDIHFATTFATRAGSYAALMRPNLVADESKPDGTPVSLMDKVINSWFIQEVKREYGARQHRYKAKSNRLL